MPGPPSEETPYVGGRNDTGRANRVGLEVPVQLRTGEASCAGVTKNIGSGGVFVATVRLLRVGDRVTPLPRPVDPPDALGPAIERG